ncbi:hypothetical protein GLOIN_2v1766521 [Rhizophagus clarus]|uniref:Uncharacterized protein n=1 Tax=Rhizophagus clarus TaxID=94130 RepID=A0A8H3M377_9GLOM|nr:hypothetical protein GLOIN_2v1766521 [Rhizophagus clarus]
MIQVDDPYDPRDFDLLLTDIDLEDIHERIPRKLDVKYLSDAPNELKGNIPGIMYGPHLRLFCATTIRIKDKIKMVTFLIDTGSSTTFISREVLCSFGIEMDDPVNDYINVGINGRNARVKMSHSHFEKVCTMGMLFLNTHKVDIHAFCGNDIFYLNFDEEKEKSGE